MAQFFFHVRDQEYLHEDDEGMDLPDLHAALDEVLRADQELGADPIRTDGLEFEITDSQGRTLLKVPVHERCRNHSLPPHPGTEHEERRSSRMIPPRRLH